MLSAGLAVQRGKQRLERQQDAAMAVAVRTHRLEEFEFRPAGRRFAAGEGGGDPVAQRACPCCIQAGAVQADQRGGGTAEQAALLAAILPSPHHWSPEHPTEYVKERQRRILEDMRKMPLL